jgi:halogenation protein CepH
LDRNIWDGEEGTVARERWDVIVMGGGPAGTTAATLLARYGYEVLLVEKEAFPRFHTGESLLPTIWEIWTRLGIVDRIDAMRNIKKQGILFNLFGESEHLYRVAEFAEYFVRPYTHNVIRAEYDLMLLNVSKESGVTVRQPAMVREVLFDGDRPIGVVIVEPDGACSRAFAPIIVDATGRASLLARRLKLRHPDPKLNKVAYFTHFTGCRRDKGDAEGTQLNYAIEGGWIWFIPLRGNLESVGAVMDIEFIRTHSATEPQKFFAEVMACCPPIAERLAGATQVMDVKVISSLSYISDHFVGDGFVCIGDATTFIDPMFSSGVYFAHKAGEIAADTIHEGFRKGDFSAQLLSRYEEKMRVPMSGMFPLIYNWYELLRNPHGAINIFALAERAPLLRRSLTLIFSGGYNLVELKQLLERAREIAASLQSVPSA